MDKNFYWLNDFKVPNGVHVYGRRYNPFGPQNYPYEIEKTREYTDNRDKAIWSILDGKSFDLAADRQRPPNFPMSQRIIYHPKKTERTALLITHQVQKRRLKFRFLKVTK